MNPLQETIGIEKALLLKGEQENIPVNGSLELTPLCNLSCRMCYVKLSVGERSSLLPLQEWLRIAEGAHEAGTLFLMLSGGEPLLYPSFQELYSALKGMGFILTVNTNGTLLTEDLADFFAENKPRRINISLYGASDAEYENLCGSGSGFQKALDAIRLLNDRKIPVKVNFSAVPENYDSFERILSLCKKLSVPVNADSLMFPSPERELHMNRLTPAEAAWIEYRNQKEQLEGETLSRDKALPETGMLCMAGRCSFSVDWQGNLRPCALLHTPSISLKDRSFREAFSLTL